MIDEEVIEVGEERPIHKKKRQWTESITATGQEIFTIVSLLLRESSVLRIVITNQTNGKSWQVPLWSGITGAVLFPSYATFGLFFVWAADFKIEVTRAEAGFDESDLEIYETPSKRADIVVDSGVAEMADGIDDVAVEDVVESADPVPRSSVERDDLKRIEGIGPKIASVLSDAGISTYAQLAQKDVSELEKIVREDAGIRVAFPATWPEQAQLAAEGKWDELAELQSQLKGGRRV